MGLANAMWCIDHAFLELGGDGALPAPARPVRPISRGGMLMPWSPGACCGQQLDDGGRAAGEAGQPGIEPGRSASRLPARCGSRTRRAKLPQRLPGTGGPRRSGRRAAGRGSAAGWSVGLHRVQLIEDAHAATTTAAAATTSTTAAAACSAPGPAINAANQCVPPCPRADVRAGLIRSGRLCRAVRQSGLRSGGQQRQFHNAWRTAARGTRSSSCRR